MTAAEIVALLEAHRFRAPSEADLQRGIGQVLDRAGVWFAREVRLNARDRIDFMIGDVGIECKVDGSLPDLIRQIDRYALHERIGALVVVTSRLRLARLPRELHGKPVHVVATMRGVL
jgi:hypothetical protein